MNVGDKKKVQMLALVVVGVLIGYFLFAGGVANSFISGASGGSCDGSSTVTTSTPTDEGDRICTEVCVPKPPECRDPTPTCPPGTTWSCQGTIAMNCGCYPPVTPPYTPPTGDTGTPTGGARGCLTDPSVCISDFEYCDTSLNQCVPMVG